MNYYEHHIGDYAEATAHLTFVEDAAYSRMMRKYYATERPLPTDVKAVQRLIGARTKEERDAVDTVLQEFFTLEADGWHQPRCDEVIARYLESEPDRELKKEGQRERQKRARERRREIFETLRSHNIVPSFDAPMSELQALLSRVTSQRTVTQPLRDVTQPVTRDNTASQSPVPSNQSPVTSKNQSQEGAQPSAASPATPAKRADLAKRISDDFTLTDERRSIAVTEKLDADRTFAKFTDYWRSTSGAKARKLDWDATWRNWCRSEADRSRPLNGHANKPQPISKFDRVIAEQGETHDVGFG